MGVVECLKGVVHKAGRQKKGGDEEKYKNWENGSVPHHWTVSNLRKISLMEMIFSFYKCFALKTYE